MGTSTDGSILPTFIFVIFNRFNPIIVISIPPTIPISRSILSVMNGCSQIAHMVILPWYMNTEAAENSTPNPSEEANTIESTPSRILLAYRIE